MKGFYSKNNSNNIGISAKKGIHSFFQPKLTINQPNDIYEQEADAVADKAMRMADHETVQTSFFKPAFTPIQRMCAGCEEEEKEMQRKEMNGGEATADSGLENYVGNLNSGGQPLPKEVRNFYEPRLGYDFSNVKVHTDSVAAKSAQSINALAYTSGNNIVFNSGQYAPDTDSGKKLMGHELTHVMQQGNNVNLKTLQLARLDCSSRIDIDVYGVNLPGATNSIITQIATANSILCQCGINLNLVGGESWVTNTLDLDSPAGVLNESQAAVTTEVRAMTDHRPGGEMIHIYNVPSNSLGARGASYGYSGRHPSTNPSVAMFNNSASDTLAHEIGHVLLNDGGHDGDPNNLMATGSIRVIGADEIRTDQCSKMP